MESKVIHVRISNVLFERAGNKAEKLGYIKPNCNPNISEYIRNLIIKDLNYIESEIIENEK